MMENEAVEKGSRVGIEEDIPSYPPSFFYRAQKPGAGRRKDIRITSTSSVCTDRAACASTMGGERAGAASGRGGLAVRGGRRGDRAGSPYHRWGQMTIQLAVQCRDLRL